ncbi:MAG: VanW family protein [Clostridiales bacterium]|nr:VanW family protein [Clostridiales bacterium]
MKLSITPEPVGRSDLRLKLGAWTLQRRRRFLWLAGGFRFARQRPENGCSCLCASHRTPLLRRLKDVDMALQHSKVTNLRLAAGRLDGVVLRPGETLSFWKQVGKPTWRKGYREGMILRNGTVASGIGGGLCQMTNLIYWMTLHTPLTVTERHRHGYDVFPDSDRKQPFGSGATCFYNYVDLMIRNDTSQTWRLSLRVGDAYLEGAWYADQPQEHRYEVYEKEHAIQGEYWGGYTRHNSPFRRVFDQAGNQVGDEFITENHAIMMYDPMLPEG